MPAVDVAGAPALFGEAAGHQPGNEDHGGRHAP